MPSANQLRTLFDKDYVVDEFIKEAVRNVELAARYGHTSERVEVPAELTRNETNDKIRKAFEGCKVSWIWYMHSYKISWKPT